MPPASFQRAREPGQKEQRRQELVRAAADLLRADKDGGLEAVTLSAIARAAGQAKSNIYRYFESREEILLEILLDDERAWLAQLEHDLAPLIGSDDSDTVAAELARTIAARPITCELIASVAGVLERNLSAEAVLRFKERHLELSIRIRNALHAALPSLPHERAGDLLRYLQALIAGLWPMANPPSAVAAALVAAAERPELRALCTEFETDLRGGLAAMLRGLVRER